MTNYYPDKWVVFKIDHPVPLYKVFGTWAGAFIAADRWKLNSGIVDFEKNLEQDLYSFFGYSGSVYYCSPDSYGVVSALYGQFEMFLNHPSGLISMMPNNTDWSKVDWGKHDT